MSLHARGRDLSFNTNLGGYRQHWQGSGLLTPGTWHRVVFHIVWSTDAAVGEVSLWFDGAKVVDAVKVRTFANNRAFIQLGILRDTIQTVETLIIDEALEGTRLEDVALSETLPTVPTSLPAPTPSSPEPSTPEPSPPNPTPTPEPTATAEAPQSSPPAATGGSEGATEESSKSSGCTLGGAARGNATSRGAALGLLLLGACGLGARRRRVRPVS
jgi:hypothetical protein